MSPDDDADDDRTLIRAPGAAAARPPAAGFQKTEWSAAHAIGAADDTTQFVGAPPPPSAPGEPDMAGNLPVGTRLGEFEITSLIGEGGFGIVYLARDHSLQRRVALKEYMPGSLATRVGGSQVGVKSERHRETFAAGLKSFINEARLLASFDHPALVKVYRFWEANGTAYMVMPFLEGTTLKDVLRELPAPPDEAWLRALLGPLTEALLVIHAEQCYHRDIAPDNVMLLPVMRRWLLLDFGAARRVIGDMTQALTVILKPGYAPVEQYAEIPGMKQGPWTDVYALAAVVYFAIMGRTPPPSVGRLLNDTYVPLVQSAAGRYSAPFLAAVDRALAVRPDERTQSIGELRHDLGLGDAVIDSHAHNATTRPLPPGTAMPHRYRPAAAPAQAGVAPAASAGARAGVPAAVSVAAAPARRSNPLLGTGIAALVLGALGFAGYALLAPKPRPAALDIVAAPPQKMPSGTAPPAVVAAAAPPPPTAAATPPPVARALPFDAAVEFERIVQAATPGFGVRAQPVKQQLRIGRDDFQFNLQSDRDGYVFVLAHGSDGALAQLVPNSVSGSVRIRKGQTWRFPTGNGFVIETQEPPGATQLLVLVSARQRSHDALHPQAEGPVRVFSIGEATAALARAHSGPGSVLAGTPICPAQRACEDEYGASILRFDAVR